MAQLFEVGQGTTFGIKIKKEQDTNLMKFILAQHVCFGIVCLQLCVMSAFYCETLWCASSTVRRINDIIRRMRKIRYNIKLTIYSCFMQNIILCSFTKLWFSGWALIVQCLKMFDCEYEHTFLYCLQYFFTSLRITCL